MTRVQISGIRLQNPPEEHIWVKSDTNVTITGITIATPGVSGKTPPKNTDGVDVTATGMFFCNNNIVAGDDNIAMSGTNLYIGYSTFGVGHGCSIGSITQNGVSERDRRPPDDQRHDLGHPDEVGARPRRPGAEPDLHATSP